VIDMADPQRLTKIVATWGPAVASEERLRQLIRTGVDVFRLNFSHGTNAEFEEAVPRIRHIAETEGRHVALLQDIQGPRIRTGLLPGGDPITLATGDTVTLTADDEAGSPSRICISYQRLADDVQPGHRILIADGTIILRAERVHGREVEATIVHGGLLGEHKGVNLPDSAVTANPLTTKDRADLEYGAAIGVDLVALSFVRRADDVAACRGVISGLGRQTPIISKIEHPQAIENLEEILEASDGVMVARGDLGVEMSPERVPLLQKQIIKRANEMGLPVITATQMIESMVDRPVPTRAEASDIANAILDGTDALMLSAETAVGNFPVEAVATMARIAIQAESVGASPVRIHRDEQPYLMARATRSLASDLGAQALLVFTRSGKSAETLSMHRPDVPIYALTPDIETARRLALWYGIWPIISEVSDDIDEMLEHGITELRNRGAVTAGDLVVLFGSAPVEVGGPPNLINVREVPKA